MMEADCTMYIYCNPILISDIIKKYDNPINVNFKQWLNVGTYDNDNIYWGNKHTCIHNMVPTSLYIRQQGVFSGKLKLEY